MKGKIIVIDGMDGTGKQTQSELLYKKLSENNDKVLLYSFPTYGESSYFIEKYLKEGYCRDINDPKLHSLFYVIDRYIGYINDVKQKYEEGYTIIFDRYVISNLIFNYHKCKDIDKCVDSSFILFHFNIEHLALKLPKPDINFIFYSDTSINNRLMENRKETDLNEKSEYQKNVLKTIKRFITFEDLERLYGKIDYICIHDDKCNIKDIAEIHEHIINRLKVENII